ncbi:P-loop NTPase fold protein [Flammeovirga sp. EKP202]|uniref:P-loop NTPase fold protein n=1 Tax=Flammeovirga sp. EKP202 TaxID=2770592 RepID=UPI00165F4ABC|nr:P-loop NTPase fold protein [Flammeovirga sp. EKP202]MBD0404758.1 hypothetical protein [Flammeovirga sp. EKP202]
MIEPIDIKNPKEVFENHFNQNRNILFSAPFGTGKTYFLRKYFGEWENENDGIVIHLSPVHYSVADNKDIFEQIKIDILIELMKSKHVKIEDIKLPSQFIIYSFIQDQINNFWKGGAASSLSKVFDVFSSGVKLSALVKNIESKKEEFDTYRQKIDSSNLEKIEIFFSSFQEVKGSVYERDTITILICDLLEQVEGEKVLIVDDLDRLDPGHLFRILNIFAAHEDYQVDGENVNKFGFNKTIIVGDIENFKSLYEHWYGMQSGLAFEGFINKFYSTKPFNFSNGDTIKLIINSWFGSSEVLRNNNPLESVYIKQFVIPLFELYVEKDSLTLRELIKLNEIFDPQKLYDEWPISKNNYYLRDKHFTNLSELINFFFFSLVELFKNNITRLKQLFSTKIESIDIESSTIKERLLAFLILAEKDLFDELETYYDKNMKPIRIPQKYSKQKLWIEKNNEWSISMVEVKMSTTEIHNSNTFIFDGKSYERIRVKYEYDGIYFEKIISSAFQRYLDSEL